MSVDVVVVLVTAVFVGGGCGSAVAVVGAGGACCGGGVGGVCVVRVVWLGRGRTTAVVVRGAGEAGTVSIPLLIRPLESEVGRVPARLPGPVGAPSVAVGRVNAVVVSAFGPVPVIGVLSTGGAVSPGALMVEVTPFAEPSWTTSYCWFFRVRLPLPRHAIASTHAAARIPEVVFMAACDRFRRIDARGRSQMADRRQRCPSGFRRYCSVCTAPIDLRSAICDLRSVTCDLSSAS